MKTTRLHLPTWPPAYLITALMLAAGDSTVNAQQTPTAADSALAACAAATESKNEANANAAADKANQLFDVALQNNQRVADALTGKARVISQCRIPFAPMMRKAALVEDSNDLLKRALATDSLHFTARFVLASNYFFMPEFLGQTDNAIREFEKLIELFGSKPIPLLATVRDRLSELYKRKGATGPTSKAAVYDIAPILVEAGKFSVDDARGSASLKRMDIVTMPGGTADVLQVFQAMPGVTRATEGSDLYVRGGDPAEAPVFVDGARMTYAGAFEGLNGGIFGVLDPNGIKKADFSSGGFSAKFGNALSGVLDITSEGRAESRSWGVGANLVSGSARIRTPLGDKGGIYFTGKGTETSALLWTQGRGDEFPRKPWSVNGMAGATYSPSNNVELKATALTETDDATRTVDVVGYRGPLHASGGTHMALLSARVLNSAGSRSLRSTVSAGRRTTKFELGVLDRDRHDDMVTLRVDGDVTTAKAVRVRTGFEAASMQAIEAGAVPTSDRLAPGSSFRAIDAQTDASHVGGYVETEMNAGSHVAFIAGTRADKLPASDSWTIDPRFAIAYRGNGWTLRTGAGLFHQSSWRTGYTT
ncbi:MAG TPA: TonB-dependent receptor plug domain-containing protein, partial [Longimicrobiales bacterium]|nr:TonB-dependent receptor plug domain-containing protein [Longimicrobiales bacterium]